jgi:probable F420-dependent oxidoreductase
MRSTRAGLKRAAALAESLGYDFFIVTEHVVVPLHVESRYPYSADGKFYWSHEERWMEAMVTLAYIAGVTEKIRLSTNIVPIITRDPLSLAKEAATVDVLSEGRLDLGLGTGWCLEEAEALGHPSDHPFGRLSETIEILRKAWGESSFAYHGRFYDFPEVGVHPHPVQGAALPIWVGGSSPRMIKIAAEQADGLLVRRPERLAEIAAALPAGKRMTLNMTIDSDLAETEAKLEEYGKLGVDRIVLGVEGGINAEPSAWEAGITAFSKRVLAPTG